MRAFACFLFLPVIGLLLAAAPDDSADSVKPRDFIDKVTQAALVILRDSKLTLPEKHKQLREIAYQYIDFRALSQLALGSHWRDLNESQRADFVEQFRQHIANTYSRITDEYTDETVSVTGDRQESHNDWTVQTKIVGTNKDGARQDVAKVDYRLRPEGGHWKIIDITIEGVSMAVNFRAQFQEILENGGIDRLINLLREKNAAADN